MIFSYLDEEIENSLALEKERQKYGLDKLSMLKKKISKLEQTESSLIEGIILYHSYPIAVLVKSYLNYSSLADVLISLDENQKKVIRDRIEFLYRNLIQYDVYPTDIKNDNILVHVNNLDVKIIDLDGFDTVVGDIAHAKEESISSLEKLLTMLDSYQKLGKGR